MSEHTARVTEAIEAVSFPSKDSYAWFGQASPLLPARVRSLLTARTARNYLLTSLQARLYQDLYLSGGASPRQSDAVTTAPAGRAPFIMMLSKANSGHGYWERGWEIQGAEGEYLHVARAGLQMRARRDESSLAPDTLPRVGADVSLRFAKEFLNFSPGFYLAASDQPLEIAPPQFLVRLYWNLTATGAVTFVSVATALLNQAGLPFRLKVLNDASAFDRCDAGVIYLPKADCAGGVDLLFEIYRTLRVSVKPGVPAFTWRLAPGLGFAEDPLGEESFGQHRCRLLADGLIRAQEAGCRGVSERFQVVADRFGEAGIALDLPFLNPGSTLPDIDWERASGHHG